MKENNNEDGNSGNEFSISIGDDLLAEALNAVEKRLYSKQELKDGEAPEIEFDIEVEVDDDSGFDNLLGGEPLEIFEELGELAPQSEDNSALRKELARLKSELAQARQEQKTSKEAARDARDENRRTQLKQKRLIDTNAQLNLDAQDLRDTLKHWEQMVAELKSQAADQNTERANQRNRLKREVDDAKRTSTEKVLKHLMVPMDHIDLALKHIGNSKQDNAVIDGFMAAIHELREGLGKAGLSAVEAEAGTEFNPELHEAIARIYSEDIPHSHIIEVHRRGFMLNGRLYRPSQVTVSGGQNPDLLDE